MNPEDRRLIESDAARLGERSEQFTTEFYATLFELDPTVRRLFPDDVTEQRQKLFDELHILVTRAVECDGPADVERFAAHARELGERHELYGVEAPMYEHVGVALIGALAEVVDDFDERHADAWRRLYRLVAGTMQTG